MHRGCSHCEEVVDLYGGDRPKYEQLVDWLGRAILYLILDMLGRWHFKRSVSFDNRLLPGSGYRY